MHFNVKFYNRLSVLSSQMKLKSKIRRGEGEHMTKIFHGPWKDTPSRPFSPTCSMYGPLHLNNLRKTLEKGRI